MTSPPYGPTARTSPVRARATQYRRRDKPELRIVGHPDRPTEGSPCPTTTDPTPPPLLPRPTDLPLSPLRFRATNLCPAVQCDKPIRNLSAALNAAD